ncbi:MAG: putative hydrolase of the superfamily [Solirubrobacteraceae bacterium]|nr:putative hydrolase of the superfamily [Solirubrobacteraceae bacterium]
MRAVLLDALGTLLYLEPPAPPLRRELAARGVEVDEETAGAALQAEIAYYRAHNLEGSDRAALAGLRRRCAGVLRDALGEAGRALTVEAVEEALLAALRFTPYPDALPALERLRAAGLRLVVVSNWDVSLHDRLAETGIAARVDGVIASAELGAAKPDPAIFRHALTMAGVAAAEAVHVGDSPAADVAGARAAGIEPILIVRAPAAAPAEPVRTVASLAELPDLVA